MCFDINNALRINGIVNLRRAKFAFAFGFHNKVAIDGFRLDGTLCLEAVVGVAEAVVFNPAVVVVNEALTVGNDVAAIESQTSELGSFVVEGKLYAAVAHLGFVHGTGRHHLRCFGVGLDGRQCGTCYEFVLLVSHFVSGFGIELGIAESYAEIEHHFLAGRFGFAELHLGQLERKRGCGTGKGVGQIH